MDRTIKDIQKDIDLLGIKGGYNVEQLLTPQDCRRLSNEIERLNNIIKEVREYIEKSKARLPQGRNDFTCEVVYSDEVVLAKELLEILNKGE